MKICTQCNSRFPDQVNFCQVCGASLPDPVEIVVVPETEAAAAPAEKKKGLLWWHILLIVVSVLVVAGIVVAVVFFAAKNNDNNPVDGEGITQEADEDDEDEDSDDSNSGYSGAEQSAIAEENTTAKKENMTASDGSPLETPEETTKDNGSSSGGNSTRPGPSGSDAGFSSEDEAINAVLSGKYYMSSTDTSSGSSDAIEIAIDGNNMEMTMNLEGMQMGILLLNGETYFVNSLNHYVNIKEFTDLMDGELDMSEMVSLADTFDFSKYNFTRTEKSSAMLDGESATLYRYKDGATELVFYFVSGELKLLEFYPDGVADGYVMAINDFRSVIPTDMLTLNGREETDLFVFVLEMIQ